MALISAELKGYVLAYLAVLRYLDLFALRNLGYVEVTLWDPQQRKQQEASEENQNSEKLSAQI